MKQKYYIYVFVNFLLLFIYKTMIFKEIKFKIIFLFINICTEKKNILLLHPK